MGRTSQRRDRRARPVARPPLNGRRARVPPATTDPAGVRRVLLAVANLKQHPRNYRTHTDDQLNHLCQSIQEHGLYRNVVVARDDTILAGHGVVLAARRLNLPRVPGVRLDLDANDPRALKLLIGDNQIAQLAGVDDRQLTDMLKTISDSDLTTLIGTGYDASQLAALVMVTRPAHEIPDADDAAEWVGLPEHDASTRPKTIAVTVFFATEDDRAAFYKKLRATDKHITRRQRQQSIWYPLRERTPAHAEAFEQDDDGAEDGRG